MQILAVEIKKPGLLGGWDWKDHGSRPALAKKYVRPHFNGKKLGMVVHAYAPSNSEKH
jgi:hypothetical protein